MLNPVVKSLVVLGAFGLFINCSPMGALYEGSAEPSILEQYLAYSNANPKPSLGPVQELGYLFTHPDEAAEAARAIGAKMFYRMYRHAVPLPANPRKVAWSQHNLWVELVLEYIGSGRPNQKFGDWLLSSAALKSENCHLFIDSDDLYTIVIDGIRAAQRAYPQRREIAAALIRQILDANRDTKHLEYFHRLVDERVSLTLSGKRRYVIRKWIEAEMKKTSPCSERLGDLGRDQ